MRYLICKDRKIIGPLPPEELVKVGGFGESSWICPEDRTGCQPKDWQKAGATPEIKDLLATIAPPAQDKPTAVTGFQPTSPKPESAPEPAPAPVEVHVPPPLPKPVATPKTEPPPLPVPAVADLHARIDALEASLHKGHSDYLKAIVDLDRRMQKAVKEAAAGAVREGKKDTHWLVNWDGITDYKAALGGLMTMLTGLVVAVGGFIGLFFKIRNLRPEEWGQFLSTLPQNPFVVAIVGSGAVISTGLHQIGLANNHAELLDKHQAIIDSHNNLAARLTDQAPQHPQLG